MNADSEHSERRLPAGLCRNHKVGKRQILTAFLPHHRQLDFIAISRETDVVSVCICREEPGSKHNLEVAHSKFIFRVPAQLYQLHRFRRGTAVLYTPYCIKHPPIKVWQHFRQWDFLYREISRAICQICVAIKSLLLCFIRCIRINADNIRFAFCCVAMCGGSAIVVLSVRIAVGFII